MPLIKTVTPQEATGEVADIYANVQEKIGMIPNAFQLYSANPLMLKQTAEYFGYFSSHPTLSPALLATIRMLVSEEGKCEYCIGFNAGFLIQRLGWSSEQVEATKADPTQANLSEKEKAMILFVLRAVRDPHTIGANDITQLHDLGWSDRDVFDALYQASRMMATNIMIDALKVEQDF